MGFNGSAPGSVICVYSACPLPHPLEAETVCWIQPARGLSQTWIIVLFVEEDKPVNHLGLPNLCS